MQQICEGMRLILTLPPTLTWTDDDLYQFCLLNRDLQIEQTAKGELIIMAPAGGESSWRNSEVIISLGNWARRDGRGIVFDSSGGFKLPNGATLAPDASWVTKTKLATITAAQKQKYIPLSPDFVIELRSPTDSLVTLKRKMEEYMANGVELGWLINPQKRQVFIYRPNSEVICLDNPATVSGESVLPGFILELPPLWAGF